MASCPACGEELPERPAIRGRDRLHGTPGSFEVRVCPSCGSGRTFPLVNSGELGGFYPEAYNAYALPANAVLRLLATALFRARYRRALGRGSLRALRTLTPGRLLDVGAGRGDLAVVLEERGWEVTGLEPSAEACEEGRRRGVRMVKGTLTGADLEGGFDAIVFQHSLEHVIEPREDLARAQELLGEGGLVLVSVPNFGCWQRRAFGSAWFHLDLPRHRSHFTAAGLERLLAASALDDAKLSTSTTLDGLPTSVHYRLAGRRFFSGGLGSYAMFGLSLALVPVSVVLDRFLGGGDQLDAAAVRPAGR
jgi:SAM-dependent methyltransferase